MILESDIAQYFDTCRPDNLKQFSTLEGFLGSQLYSEPDLQKSVDVQVAIIGIDETRNAYPMPYAAKADNVRYWLYQLAAFNNLKIIDFGNLILGNSAADTYSAISYITESLVSGGVIPIYIGGSHDLTLPIVEGLWRAKGKIEIGLIDSCFDIADSLNATSRSYLLDILRKFTSSVKCNVIGSQVYFTSQSQSDLLDEYGVDKYRLGAVRQNINSLEPVLRDCDFVSFDASAVRQADMPAAHQPSPNGLYTEEACQLANFAGISDRSKAFGIFGIVSHNTPLDISAHLTAQIIWHYIYGVSQRENDYPACDFSRYKKIFVKLEAPNTSLVFYQNPQNNRFWMEMAQKNNAGSVVVSCSKADYMALVNNEIPERIKKTFVRYGI